MTEPEMTREEWLHRYAKHIMKASDISEYHAFDLAKVGAEPFEQEVLPEGAEIVWEDPEGTADDDMERWGEDD